MEKYLQQYLKERNIPINRLEANSIQEGYQLAVKRVCEWLKNYRQDTPDGMGYIAGIVNDKTIEDFRKAME